MAKKVKKAKQGLSVINDNMGQWAHPGKITKIDSNNITMKGVPYPVLGISNTNDMKIMYPEKDYNFEGDNVTEIPLNKNGGKLPTYQNGGTVGQELNNIFLKTALLKERQQKRDSVRSSLMIQFPKQYTKVNQGMLDYYKKEPKEYLSLDVNLLDDMRKKQLLAKYSTTKYENGGKVKKAQQGFSTTDIPQEGASLIELEEYNNPQMASAPKKFNMNWGNIAQGAGALAYGATGNEAGQGPSGAQKAVGQFGPWGAAISQVSQIGTNITDKSNSGFVYTAGKTILDPAAAWTNKDLSKSDRILGGLNPIYGGIKAFQAKKDREKKEKKLKNLVKQASELQDPDANRRRYVRPEDQLVEPNELYPTYGVGTNYLKHGGNIPDMEKGGELEIYQGGGAETISENPFLPDNGETIMFKGNSHTNGGIDVRFGKSKVEVEGGEPAVKLQDGKSSSLVVFGDMKIPPYGVAELGDPNAKGKKFKSYIKDLSEIESKSKKVLEKGVNIVNETTPLDSFDKIKMSTGKALIEGSNMKLKDAAAKKQIAANIQNAILDTADELGLNSSELAKGNIKKDRKAKKKAQDGDILPSSISKEQVQEYISKGWTLEEAMKRISRQVNTPGQTNVLPLAHKGKMANEQEYWNNFLIPQLRKGITPEELSSKKYMSSNNIEKARQYYVPSAGSSKTQYIPISDDFDQLPTQIPVAGATEGTPTPIGSVQKKQGLDWMDVANSILPFVRPSNQLKLDPNQLAGEMYTMATNQQDPVRAQLYRPLLDTVSDISLQDQLNANQADFNSIQRLTAQNPAAQHSLAAQKYAANSSVLGEQFRLNQAQKMNTFNKNRATLNDAQLRNLAILDQQFVRQSQAKSNTKAISQKAVSSIAEKILRNKLENRTLGVYENLYNYRFDNKGRAINMNGFAKFAVDSGLLQVDEDGKIIMNEEKVKRDKNGMIINSTETQRVIDKKKTGGVVKSMKGY